MQRAVADARSDGEGGCGEVNVVAEYDFCVPEAQRLANLTGIWSDLRMAKNLADQFLSLPTDSDKKNFEPHLAFCISALIIFCRAVGNGVRGKLPENLKSKLTEPDLQNYQEFVDMRDKWAAHSVNAHEEAAVTLSLQKHPGGKVSASSIGIQVRNTVFLSPVKMKALSDLCSRLIIIVDDEFQDERVRVLNTANKSFDLAELFDNPNRYIRPNNSVLPNKRRIDF